MESSDTQYVIANGIRLAYDEFGGRDLPVILLVMGLGTQMIAWPVAFCEALAAHGFRVIRFDNRDMGLSEKFVGKPPKLLRLLLMQKLGLPFNVPFTLNDMAKDETSPNKFEKNYQIYIKQFESELNQIKLDPIEDVRVETEYTKLKSQIQNKQGKNNGRL